MDDEEFVGYYPHCERIEFRDDEDFFYHVSMCEWEQHRDAADDWEE